MYDWSLNQAARRGREEMITRVAAKSGNDGVRSGAGSATEG